MAVRKLATLLVVACVGAVACAGGGGEAAGAPTAAGSAPPATTAPSATPGGGPSGTDPAPTTAPGSRYRTPGWVAAENARPGTTAWLIDPKAQPRGSTIEGYADRTSYALGESVVLRVSASGATTWRAELYRMGWYAGAKGRLVWASPDQRAATQAEPTVDRKTGMAEARWEPSLAIPVTEEHPPGAYLVKLVASSGAASYVPFTVRDDLSTAAIGVMASTTTWQAYNSWGGCSLYGCAGVGPTRAVVVSYDRPYAYNQGAANFVDHELSLIGLVEELGLDVSYFANEDLHHDPARARRHRAIISLGHDEYYSTPMRRGLEAARDAGVNLAFLGANAVYRHIRLEPGADGVAYRRMVNYRSTADPITKADPQQATVEWRNSPLSRPENALVGIMYGCTPTLGALRVTDASAWVFAGTGLRNGDKLPGVVGNEFDRVYRNGSMPENLQVLAHSVVTCRGEQTYADMSYYAAPSGAGVFATGTIHWICTIDGACNADARAARAVKAVTTNVLQAFAAGPAGLAHPSRANLDKAMEPDPDAPPTTTSTTVAGGTTSLGGAPTSQGVPMPGAPLPGTSTTVTSATTTPPTTPPPTTTPPSTPPPTTAPATTLPATTAPPTTMPATTVA